MCAVFEGFAVIFSLLMTKDERKKFFMSLFFVFVFSVF